MTKKLVLPILATTTLLAACGGSSSSPLTFEETLSIGDDIFNSVEGLQFTDPSTLPTSGQATYEGVLAASADGFDSVAGEMTLTANFSDDEDFLSGSVTNFVTLDDEAVNGTLTINDPAVNRAADTSSEYTYAADLVGELSDDEGTYTVDGFLLGDFVGEDYTVAEGIVFGTVTTEGEDVSSDIDGDFIAAR